VVPEDYFRVLKERKLAEKNLGIGKPSAAIRNKLESMQQEQSHRNKSTPEKVQPHGMPYWLTMIDPEMEDEEAIQFIELPQETLYLIDKVVRQKAKAGPIGIDNSEFINIEIEDEFRQKNQYLQNLVEGGHKKTTEDEDDSDNETHEGNKENQNNQRLLDRLSTAAARVPRSNSKSTLVTTTAHGLVNNQSHISATSTN
jgi:hypothetical protein